MLNYSGGDIIVKFSNNLTGKKYRDVVFLQSRNCAAPLHGLCVFNIFFCYTKKGAVKKRAIKKTATTLKRVGKQSFLWYNKFDEKIPTRI